MLAQPTHTKKLGAVEHPTQQADEIAGEVPLTESHGRAGQEVQPHKAYDQ